MCTALLAAFMLLGSSCAPRQAERVKTYDEVEFRTLRDQLTGQGRSARTRLEAARLLLRRTGNEELRLLRQVLADPTNPASQIAVASAIALEGGEQGTFITPLIKMLKGDEPSVREPAARALVTFKKQPALEKLVAVASDVRQPRAVRLVAIKSLRRVIDRRCVEGLIDLLGDDDASIRSAAANSLQQMTHIRRFGADKARWARWWNENKDSSQLEWLSSMTEALTRENIALDEENASLRERLVSAMEELYNVSSKPQRPKIIIQMLGDPLGDIRLLGITLADNLIVSNEDAFPELRQRVRVMIDDEDPRVRKFAALLVATIAGDKTTGRLLSRLSKETDPDVREGLFQALGRIKSQAAVPAVLRGIKNEDDREAAAAAGALIHIADGEKIPADISGNIASALAQRYELARKKGSSVELREALLMAMRAVGHPSLKGVLKGALKDPSGAIRLASVSGLSKMEASDAAPEIASLIGDEDRGVRQAVISALATMDGQRYLKSILSRSDPKIESDQAVRKQACEAVLGICLTLKPEELPGVLEILTRNPETRSLRISILKLYLKALKARKSPRQASVSYELGTELLKAGRASEAVVQLKDALGLIKTSKLKTPTVSQVWLKYIDSMLEAGDPELADVLAGQKDKKAFADGFERLRSALRRIRELKNPEVIPMVQAVRTKLKQRLTEHDLKFLDNRLEHLKKLRLAADRRRVEKILPSLFAVEVSVRDKAVEQIKVLGKRAVRPLLEQLKLTLADEKPEPGKEKMIVELIRRVMPELGEYPAEAEIAKRIKIVDQCIQKVP